MSIETVLVTGGAGLIGSHIVDLLLEKGYKVKILDILAPEVHYKIPDWIPNHPNAEFIQGDIRDANVLKECLKGVDFISHQAVWGGFSDDYSRMITTNVNSLDTLFKVIKDHKHPIKKIVVASSQAIYGEGIYRCSNEDHGIFHPEELRSMEQLDRGDWEIKCPKTKCNGKCIPVSITEDTKPSLPSIYAITKYAEEKMAFALGREQDIPVVALRYGMTYGPRQSLSNPYCGICSIFSMQILSDKDPVIFEDGLQSRDFMYVTDNAKANVLAIEDSRCDWQVFNVGTGIRHTIKSFVEKLAKGYKKDIKCNLTGEFRPFDMRHFYVNSDKLQALGWKPCVSLDEGIKKYTKWINTQDKPKKYFSQALDELRDVGIIRNPTKN